MPPPVEPAPAPVELGPLRELLAVDRRHAGELRKGQGNVALTKVAYTTPLHLQWRRAYRRQRRLRVTVWSVGFLLVAVLVAATIWQLVRWSPPLWRPTRWTVLSLGLANASTDTPMRWNVLALGLANAAPEMPLRWSVLALGLANEAPDTRWSRILSLGLANEAPDTPMRWSKILSLGLADETPDAR